MKRNFLIVVGNQGCGKSVWCRQYTTPSRRFLAYDPMRSYRADFEFSEEDGHKILQGQQKHFRVGSDDPDDVPLLFNMAYASGKCLLLVEECGTIFIKRANLEPPIRRVIFTGRHRSVDIVLVAQRAASIPIDIRSQANRVISFRQTEPDDVAAVASIIGKQYKDTLPHFPELKCVDWQPGRSTNEYILRIAKSVPSNPPPTPPEDRPLGDLPARPLQSAETVPNSE